MTETDYRNGPRQGGDIRFQSPPQVALAGDPSAERILQDFLR